MWLFHSLFSTRADSTGLITTSHLNVMPDDKAHFRRKSWNPPCDYQHTWPFPLFIYCCNRVIGVAYEKKAIVSISVYIQSPGNMLVTLWSSSELQIHGSQHYSDGQVSSHNPSRHDGSRGTGLGPARMCVSEWAYVTVHVHECVCVCVWCVCLSAASIPFRIKDGKGLRARSAVFPPQTRLWIPLES